MAVVTLVEDDSQSVYAAPPTQKKDISEILYFPKISQDLGDDSENTLQEFWVLEKGGLDKFIVETKKYDEAATTLTEARTKLLAAKTEEDITSAEEEVSAAQDNMRSVLEEGFGKKDDETTLPIPQGKHKGLIECIGFVNKRTFYIANHDLKKVQDANGKRKFRFATDTMEASERDLMQSVKAAMTDSEQGLSDEKLKNKFWDFKADIVKEWKFGERSAEGQVSVRRVNKFITNPFIKEFLLNDDNCKLIDNAIKYFNDTANFSYQQKEQKLEAIKTWLSKPDDEFDHYDWGKALLGMQEIWHKTDPDFVEKEIKVKYQKFPLKLKTREKIISDLYDHGLPEVVFDASGGAQFMRYGANCGGAVNFDFTKGTLGASYSANAKFSMVEAGADFNYYFPHNNGFKMVFDAPVLVECFESKIMETSRTASDPDPMFAHDSEFMLPSAILETGEQAAALLAKKRYENEEEILIQLAGHTDTTGNDTYNKDLGYRRASAAHAIFTYNVAQWTEFFDKGHWGDVERDLMLVSNYMIDQDPIAFKNHFAGAGLGDTETAEEVLLRFLKIAVSPNYGYPVEDIKTKKLLKHLPIELLDYKELDGGFKTIPLSRKLKGDPDKRMVQDYFSRMRDFALFSVAGLDEEIIELFYIDTELHPVLSGGENMLKKNKKGRVAENRRIALIPWHLDRIKEETKAEIDLGEARLHVYGQVSCFVGATIGLSAKMEINTYKGAVQLVGKKKEKDKMAEYQDKEIVPTDAGANNATAKVEAFAGAKAEAGLGAALEWNNPEAKTGGWGLLASVGGSVTGTAGAGIEGEFKIGFDNDTKTFQIKMKAQATWGIGGGGAVCLSVGVQQLYDFVVLVYHKLEEHDFNFVDIFENVTDSDGVPTESRVNVYELYTSWVTKLWQEKEFVKAGAATLVGVTAVTGFKVLQEIDDMLEEYDNYKMRKEETRNMITNIHADDMEFIKLALPETKGYMLFMLTNFSVWEWGEVFSGDPYREAELAALKVIRSIKHAREWQEVMERLTVKVEGGSYEPYSEKKSRQDKRVKRVSRAEIFLRNRLLNDTEDWDEVRLHMRSLKNKKTAWNRRKPQHK